MNKLRILYRFIYRIYAYYFRDFYIIKVIKYKYFAFLWRCLNSSNKRASCIVSFTTISERFNQIDVMVGSLLRQSVKPEKIIMWIGFDPEQYRRMGRKAKKLYKAGITIRQTKDIGPHQKLIYALNEFKDIPIITVDDDKIYTRHCIEDLLKVHQRFSGNIVCHRAHLITFDHNNAIQKFADWVKNSPRMAGPSLLLLPLGLDGVLYPPDCLDDQVTDASTFMELAPRADDVWFKAMSLLKGTKVVKTTPFHYARFRNVHYKTDKRALWDFNDNGGNDAQIRNVFEQYPQLLDILRSETT